MIQFCRTITVLNQDRQQPSGRSIAGLVYQGQAQIHNPNLKRKVICLTHNFKGYDSYFILEQCHHQYMKLDQLVNGAKILSLSLAGLTFLGAVVGKLLEGFEQQGYEGRLVDGQSSGAEAPKSCMGNLQKSRKEWRKSLAWT